MKFNSKVEFLPKYLNNSEKIVKTKNAGSFLTKQY